MVGLQRSYFPFDGDFFLLSYDLELICRCLVETLSWVFCEVLEFEPPSSPVFFVGEHACHLAVSVLAPGLCSL